LLQCHLCSGYRCTGCLRNELPECVNCTHRREGQEVAPSTEEPPDTWPAQSLQATVAGIAWAANRFANAAPLPLCCMGGRLQGGHWPCQRHPPAIRRADGPRVGFNVMPTLDIPARAPLPLLHGVVGSSRLTGTALTPHHGAVRPWVAAIAECVKECMVLCGIEGGGLLVSKPTRPGTHPAGLGPWATMS
jgi:hypothetical protein